MTAAALGFNLKTTPMTSLFRRHFLCAAWLLLAALPGAGQYRDPLPVPDIPGYRTLKCDLHIHTVFSDGDVWPTTRVSEAWREGLDVIAITDHAGYNPKDPDVKLDLTRPYAIAAPLAARLGIILIPGVEVMEGDTHFNLLFVTDPNAFLKLRLADALRAAHARNAFITWNHPGWRQPAAWFPNVAALYDEKPFHGVELVNGHDYYPPAFPWIEEKKLTILANTDVHAPTYPAYTGRNRPLTLVFARTPDSEGVREALFARRTAAWMGGEMWGNEEYLRGLWQAAVGVENDQLTFAPGRTQAVLRLRNRSALRFVLGSPKTAGWLRASGAELQPEGGAGIALSVTKEAPAGGQTVQLEFEVTNLHTAPGRNLAVSVPLRVQVQQP